MGRWLLLVLATTAICGSARTGERPYLFPVDRDLSVLSGAPDLQAYHLALRDALLKNAGTRSWDAVVVPSFEREWAVYVEASGARGGQRLVCTVMQTQLWYQMASASERANNSDYSEAGLAALRRANKATDRFAVPISAGTAAGLERVWSRMISEARQPPEPPRCLDGTSYILFQLEGGARIRGGWGRCPQDGTAPGKGLTVLETLRRAAADSKPDAWEHEVAQLLASLE